VISRKVHSTLIFLLKIDTYNFIYCVNRLGDLLENYCWDDDLINVSRLMFSLITLLTFPLECMVTKAVIDQTIRGGTNSTLLPMSKKRHAIITISILVVTYLISISTKCLGIALELNVSDRI